PVSRSASARRAAGYGSRGCSWSAAKTGALPAARRFASNFRHEDDEEGDKGHVPREPQPRPRRVELERQPPVAEREPELRGHEGDGQEPRRDEPAPAADEWH